MMISSWYIKIFFGMCVVLLAVLALLTSSSGYFKVVTSRIKYKLYAYGSKDSRPFIKNSKPFADVILSVNFNHPFYAVIPLLKEFYGPVFETIIFCGPEKSVDFDVVVIEGSRGYFGYMCITEAIKKYPNFIGYLYVNDDMVVNWWNFIHQPKDRIWFGKDIINEAGAEMDKPAPCCWHWWTDAKALDNCRNAFDSLELSSTLKGKTHFEIYSKNTNSKRLCLRAWSDFMYIPQQLAQTYMKFSTNFYKHEVFLEVAVSTILLLLDTKDKIVNLDGQYLPDVYGDIDFSDGNVFADIYDSKKSFYHPVKLSVQGRALNLFKTNVIQQSMQCLQKLESNNASIQC